MNQTIIYLLVALATTLTGRTDASVAADAVVTLPFVDRGWYDARGRHDPANTNYFAGEANGFIDRGNVHNFFIFDLSNVTQTIASAELRLSVLGDSSAFKSLAGQETYSMFEVVTSLAALRAGTGGVAAHADLGSGVFYGSRVMTAADNGRVITIHLNGPAVTSLNAASGLFALGGASPRSMVHLITSMCLATRAARKMFRSFG